MFLPSSFLLSCSVKLFLNWVLSIGNKTVHQLNAENEPRCTIVKDQKLLVISTKLHSAKKFVDIIHYTLVVFNAEEWSAWFTTAA